MVIRITVVLLCVALVSAQLEVGDTCEDPRGASGVCTAITKCPSAIQNIKKKKRTTNCSYIKGLPIVCCVNESDQIKESPSTYRDTSVRINKNECPPISSNLTTPKTGQKALDKCIEYQQNLIYPCETSYLPEGGMIRRDYCNWKPESLIIGGENTYAGEYPHMALLGYGKDQTIEWLCGGTLVSDKYVLTAGHCTYSKDVGAVTKIRVGIYSRSESVTDKNEYNVAKILKHPDYKPPISYNDIALLEADRTIHLDRFAVPACLHDGAPMADDDATVTGWGTTKYKMNAHADILQKAILKRFPDDECSEKYSHVRRMPSGYDLSTQICYGDRNSSRDTCQGDSGGPIQVKHPKLYCMYSVIGVTSTGRWCGMAGEPGIYVRVAHYLGWIESVVWP